MHFSKSTLSAGYPSRSRHMSTQGIFCYSGSLTMKKRRRIPRRLTGTTVSDRKRAHISAEFSHKENEKQRSPGINLYLIP